MVGFLDELCINVIKTKTMSDPFRCARTWISHISLCRRMCVLEATRAQFTTCAGKYLTVRKMSVASCLDLERPAEGFEAFEGRQTAGRLECL